MFLPKTYSPLERLHQFTRRCLWILLPSFLTHGGDEAASTRPTASARTPYLDGMRGVAALFVFIYHTTWTYQGWVDFGFGDGPGNMRLIQLPGIRLPWAAGHAMVAVFFVIGGYVSSVKAIRLARNQAHEKVYLTLTSSLFRRAIRLYLPVFTSTFIVMWTIRFGLWEPARQYLDMPYINYPDIHYWRLPTLGLQLYDWFIQTMGLTNVWWYYNQGHLQPYYHPYDPHLWTVPMEMRGSLVLTLALLGCLRCRVAWRFALMMGTIVFCVYWDRWECMHFLLGGMLAEAHLIAMESDQQRTSAGQSNGLPMVFIGHSNDLAEARCPSLDETEASNLLFEQSATAAFSNMGNIRLLGTPRAKRVLRISLFVLAIFVLSAPNDGMERSWAYWVLPYFIPNRISDPKRFVHGIGAALLVVSVSCTPALQKPFNSSFAQYLGKISYSLYICHGPMIHMVGMYVTPRMWAVTGTETTAGWLLGFLMGSAVLAIAVFWAADVFWRLVDRKCVSFGRWLEGVCFDS